MEGGEFPVVDDAKEEGAGCVCLIAEGVSKADGNCSVNLRSPGVAEDAVSTLVEARLFEDPLVPIDPIDPVDARDPLDPLEVGWRFSKILRGLNLCSNEASEWSKKLLETESP